MGSQNIKTGIGLGDETDAAMNLDIARCVFQAVAICEQAAGGLLEFGVLPSVPFGDGSEIELRFQRMGAYCHVCTTMLDGLKRADRCAELGADLGVIACKIARGRTMLTPIAPIRSAAYPRRAREVRRSDR